MVGTGELKPCPFCGGEADEYEGEYGNGVYCTECGAMVGEPIHLGFDVAERVSYEQAIEAWNTRVETVTITTGITTVTDTPQVTYAPVVRCRDCRFSPDDGQTCERDGDEFNVTLVRPDGFCAWGESAWVTCKCGEDIERHDRIQVCPSCGRRVMA